jgi:hypothetical protein
MRYLLLLSLLVSLLNPISVKVGNENTTIYLPTIFKTSIDWSQHVSNLRLNTGCPIPLPTTPITTFYENERLFVLLDYTNLTNVCFAFEVTGPKNYAFPLCFSPGHYFSGTLCEWIRCQFPVGTYTLTCILGSQNVGHLTFNVVPPNLQETYRELPNSIVR